MIKPKYTSKQASKFPPAKKVKQSKAKQARVEYLYATIKIKK
jgi:hypothetical protein